MRDDDEDGHLPPPMDGRSSDDDTPAQLELEREANAKLKERLRLVQRRRNEARRQAASLAADAVNDRKYQIETARASQQDLFDAIQTVDRRIATARTQLQRARGWHVLAGDAYHVDQEIVFLPLSSSPSASHGGRNGITGTIMTTTISTSPPAAYPHSSSNGTAVGPASGHNHNNNTTVMVMIGTMNGLRLAAPTYTATGSWKEVNSALGYVALLLSQLERQLLSTTGAKTTGHNSKNGTTTTRPALLPPFRYTVVAAGGGSKIGPRNTSTNNYNNLFFAEDSFTFFSKRNFNTALGYLLGHVSDLTRVVLILVQQQQQYLDRDERTTVTSSPPPPPYEINETARTIGGVPLIWIDDVTSATDFTRAARYLLTNLQHLLGCQEAALAAWGGTDGSGGGRAGG
jgi:hypothetical protein